MSVSRHDENNLYVTAGVDLLRNYSEVPIGPRLLVEVRRPAARLVRSLGGGGSRSVGDRQAHRPVTKVSDEIEAASERFDVACDDVE